MRVFGAYKRFFAINVAYLIHHIIKIDYFVDTFSFSSILWVDLLNNIFCAYGMEMQFILLYTFVIIKKESVFKMIDC